MATGEIDLYSSVFVNRDVNMKHMKVIGWDLDLTVAAYASPVYEATSFNFMTEYLISTGYPPAISSFTYRPTFPIIGLWFDCKFGNLLKVDGQGQVDVCIHGFCKLSPAEIRTIYPNKFVHLEEKRMYLMNTRFNFPEVNLLACVIDFFTKTCKEEIPKTAIGMKCIDRWRTYKELHEDIRNAMNFVHDQGQFKQWTVEHLESLLVVDGRLSVLLDRFRDGETTTFLLTNSGFEYTDAIMHHLLGSVDRQWMSYYDHVVVNANKPIFFGNGGPLRLLDQVTGAPRAGCVMTMEEGQVYTGGCCKVFMELIGATDSDILYIGDSIIGDIQQPKVLNGWKTMLIVPDLEKEMRMVTEYKPMMDELIALQKILKDMTESHSAFSVVMDQIKALEDQIDDEFGPFGGPFRSGNKESYYAAQVLNFADMYSTSHLNLLEYPVDVSFVGPVRQMEHEKMLP